MLHYLRYYLITEQKYMYNKPFEVGQFDTTHFYRLYKLASFDPIPNTFDMLVV